MNAPKFTEEEIVDLMCDGFATSIDGREFEVVESEMIDNDTEKSSVTFRYVIESDGKYYTAELSESPWYRQDTVNAEEPWEEVKRKRKTIYTYE